MLEFAMHTPLPSLPRLRLQRRLLLRLRRGSRALRTRQSGCPPVAIDVPALR
jgi:hypothetical protein